MYSSNNNTVGWVRSDVRTGILLDVFDSMPYEVQNAIKAVNKQTIKGDKSGLEETSDRLFLLSEAEVFGTTDYSNGLAEGSQYEYYANGGSTIKNYKGSAYWWWLRGPCDINSEKFTMVKSTGLRGNATCISSGKISFGFCF